ncbi:MAG: A/G-specific adenine glycosylase [Candidatus Riflebacteria bacterium]|nr:A/G-specific adenine glycosylase [Candidatus Riflebacteria bacterium]
MLAWYRRHRRDLPWRRTRDPYRIWVSEIMLQQTTVQTVLPYYHAFLEVFPTVEALAESPLDAVLARWSGLGYYSRARNLKRAAERVVEEHGGSIPDDRERLQRLPGIGEYTAGAILSIAFSRREPVLDGNVIRVLARLFLLAGDPRKQPLRNVLWTLAARMVPADDPGDFNQGLMELGATVCAPRSPTCGSCPLATICGAGRAGRAGEFPTPQPRPVTVPVRLAAAVISSCRGFLMVRRARAGLLADLWEFPGGEIQRRGDAQAQLARLLLDRHSLRVTVGRELARFGHSITNRRMTVIAFEARLEGARRAVPPGSSWVDPGDIGSYGVSSMALKILAGVGRQRP